MKIFPVLFLSASFIISGCALKVDSKASQTLVENLLNDLKHENYSALDKYYTSSFNESEPLEQKIEKFKRLMDAMGAMKSFGLISSKESYDSVKGINQVELKYKVMCERITVKETFLVINDEGDLKVIFQNIENLK